MANDRNLKPFSRENQPLKRGRAKGTPNRATVLKKFLRLKTEVTSPANLSQTLQVTLHEAAALGLIGEAMTGSVAAWREIQDTLYGKITDKQEMSGADDPLKVEVVWTEPKEELTDDERAKRARAFLADYERFQAGRN